jgi:uncharacterized protein (TIGR02147 family)
MMPVVFEYLDYRKFLADFYTSAKAQRSFYSYQFMAYKVGMDTSNLAKVLLGRRHLPGKAIARFRDLCKFSDQEFEYFETLIRWAKARSEKKARELFERLTRLQGGRSHILDTKQYEYYRRWYHAAIYALLDCIDFRGNHRSLAALMHPPISVAQAKESVALLMDLGLVQVNGDGRYVPVQKALSTGEQWKSYAVHEYQKDTIGLALRSLDEVKKEDRDISTLTFSATKADLDALRRLTREYRRSVVEMISSSTGADRVYQLNMQLFPLSSAKGAA